MVLMPQPASDKRRARRGRGRPRGERSERRRMSHGERASGGGRVDAGTLLFAVRRRAQDGRAKPKFLQLFIAGSGPRAYAAAANRCGAFPWLPYSRAMGSERRFRMRQCNRVHRGNVRAYGEIRGTMRNSIAMMNTKGGVGKSTLVLALAETLVRLPRQERAGDRQRRPGERVEHADDGLEPLQAAERRRDHRRLSARDRAQGPDGRLAEVHRAQRLRRRRRALGVRAAERHATHPARARGVQGEPARAAARGHRRAAGGRAQGLRYRADRLPSGAVGAHRELAARGRLPHLADQGRLRLGVRARGLPPLQEPQPRDGLCREPGRHRQYEGAQLGIRRGVSPLAREQPGEPLLQPAHPAHVGAAGCRELPDLEPQLPRQVSGPGRSRRSARSPRRCWSGSRRPPSRRRIPARRPRRRSAPRNSLAYRGADPSGLRGPPRERHSVLSMSGGELERAMRFELTTLTLAT